DGDAVGLCDRGRGIAGDPSQPAGKSRTAFDVDHRGIFAAHGRIVHDLFRRGAVRALPARTGDRGAGGAALRKSQGGDGGCAADAGGAGGRFRDRGGIGRVTGKGRGFAAPGGVVAGAEIGHGGGRGGGQRNPAR